MLSYAELPDLLTPDEARAYLRVGRSTIYEMLRENKLPHLRCGVQYRIPKQGLRRMLESLTFSEEAEQP